MLLPVETDAILEEGCCKRNVIRTLCSGGGEMIFALLTEVVAGHVVISLIYIRETCFEETLSGAFFSHSAGFHDLSDDYLNFLIWISPWRGFRADKSCCRCVGRPWGHGWYVGGSRSLSTGKFIWASKRRRGPRRGGAGGLRDTTLDPTRASASFGSH